VRVREYHCESARVSVRDVGGRFCVKATGRLTLRTGSAGSPQQQQATCSGTEGGLKRSLADWPCARPACMCPFRVYKSQMNVLFPGLCILGVLRAGALSVLRAGAL
jgi:hypothetical protein